MPTDSAMPNRPVNIEPSFLEQVLTIRASDSDVTSEDAFEHALTNILKVPPDHPIRLAIHANFMQPTISECLLFTDEFLRSMTYPSSTTNRLTGLLPGASHRLVVFKQFVKSIEKDYGDILPNSKWLEFTSDAFDRFIRQPLNLESAPNPGNRTPSVSSSLPQFTRSEKAVIEFRKSLKREISAFPKLQDEKHWDNFRRSVAITARTQGIEDVLDVEYIYIYTYMHGTQ